MLFEKFFKGVAPLQGIEQELEGYSRPAKNRRSAQDIWIFDDHAVPQAHTISITHSIALSSGTFPYLSLVKIITVAMLQRPRLGVGQSFGEPQQSRLRWSLSLING